MVTKEAQRSGIYWERCQRGNPPKKQGVGHQWGSDAKRSIFMQRAQAVVSFAVSELWTERGQIMFTGFKREARWWRGGRSRPQIILAAAPGPPWGATHQEGGKASPSMRTSILSSKCSLRASLSWVLLQVLCSLELTSASEGSILHPSKKL